MKKLILVVCVLFLNLSAIGCGKADLSGTFGSFSSPEVCVQFDYRSIPADQEDNIKKAKEEVKLKYTGTGTYSDKACSPSTSSIGKCVSNKTMNGVNFEIIVIYDSSFSAALAAKGSALTPETSCSSMSGRYTAL